jgi:hypothetical protein
MQRIAPRERLGRRCDVRTGRFVAASAREGQGTEGKLPAKVGAAHGRAPRGAFAVRWGTSTARGARSARSRATRWRLEMWRSRTVGASSSHACWCSVFIIDLIRLGLITPRVVTATPRHLLRSLPFRWERLRKLAPDVLPDDVGGTHALVFRQGAQHLRFFRGHPDIEITLPFHPLPVTRIAAHVQRLARMSAAGGAPRGPRDKELQVAQGTINTGKSTRA